MKKKTRSKLHDSIIVFLCLVVCSGSLVLFWKDLNHSTIRRDKDAIGTIAFKYKIAQRKFNDRVVWERLRQDSPLYNADTIRTADLSMATITFKDGTVVDISERTMLQIFYSEEGYSLSFEGGNVTVDTTASAPEGKKKNAVAVKMNDGSVVNLDKGSKVAAASNSSSGVNTVQVKAGKSSIETISGQKEALENGDSIRLQKIVKENVAKTDTAEKASAEKKSVAKKDNSKDDSTVQVMIKKEPITVTSIPSEMHVLSFDKKEKPVEIAWNTSKDLSDRPVKIQTSHDKNFNKIEKTYSATGKSAVSVEPASSGTTYWRVFPEGEEEAAAVGKITVDPVEKIHIEAPVKGTKFRYKSEEPKIAFAWKGNTYASRYKLEVSTTPDMKNTVLSEEVSDQRVNLDSFSEGNYYWQITPYYTENNIGYASPSPVSSFTVSRIEKLEPPVLGVPLENAVINAGKEGASMAFSWKGDEEKGQYQLMVSKTKDFKEIVYNSKTDKKRVSQSFKPEELPAGEYYWKVMRKDESEAEMTSSEIRHFKIRKFIPGTNRLIYPPENYSVEKAQLTDTAFMWKLSDEYKHSETKSVLQFSRKADFSEMIKEIDTKDTLLSNISLKDGTYYWRVAVSNSEVSDATAYTENRIIRILNEISSPKIVRPLPEQTLTVYGDCNVVFAWNKVTGADYYKLRVFDPDTNRTVQEIGSVKGTKVNLSIPVEKSAANKYAYACSVQAVCEETENSGLRVSKISEQNFNLRLSQPVQLISPVNKTVIPGLSALREPVVLLWKQNDKVAKSTFILRKREANGNYKILETVENPGQKLKFERLPAGFYEWTVSASSPEGIPLDAEKAGNFEISAVPALPQAKLLRPEEKFIVNGAYLRKNRHIQFEWTEVPGATDYHFELFMRNPDGTLHKVYEQKKAKHSSITIKNLKIFDVGTFEWHVTPYCHASDGFEEQKGKENSGKFKIDFGLPSKVKTNDPGKMYGD